jgi:hypothetical protein
MPVPPRPDRERSVYDDRVKRGSRLRIRIPILTTVDTRPLRVRSLTRVEPVKR